MKSFKYFLKINESKNEYKIKNFINDEDIINYVNELSPKFSIWYANKIFILYKEKIKNYISENNSNEETINYYKEQLNKIKNKIPITLDNDDKDKFLYKLLSSNKHVFSSINDWLKSPLRTEKINLSELSLKDAYHKSELWHEEIVATGVVVNEKGTILMTFDDGYYWIDLETNSCEDEANAMGHCGISNGTTLYSLRCNQKPVITAAIDEDVMNIVQMKGKQNKKPLDKYHKYIVELLCSPNVSSDVKLLNKDLHIQGIIPAEYLPENDFELQDLSEDNLIKIMENNKSFENTLIIKAILYKKGKISGEELANTFPDLKFIDNNFYFLVDDWSNFSSEIFSDEYIYHVNRKDGTRVSYNTVYALLCWDTAGEFDYDGKIDLSYDLNNENLKIILNYLIEKTYEITNNTNEDIIIIDENNSKINKNNIIIKDDKNDNEIYLLDILKDDEFEINDITYYLQNSDELYDKINLAYCNSCENSMENDAHETVMKSILKEIDGELNNHLIDNKISIKLKNIMKTFLYMKNNNNYKTFMDLLNDNLKNLKIDEPYYGWDSSDYADYMNDNLTYRLND
jgi:hypothetical protein